MFRSSAYSDLTNSLPFSSPTNHDFAKDYLLPFTTLFVLTIRNKRLTGPQLPMQCSQPTLDRFQKRLPFVQHLVEDQPFLLSSFELGSLSDLLSVIHRGRDITPKLNESEVERPLIVWTSCELLRDGDDRLIKEEEGLVRCGDGVEMMACGRVSLPFRTFQT